MNILKKCSAIDEEDLEYIEDVEESEEHVFLWLEEKVMTLLTAQLSTPSRIVCKGKLFKKGS